MMHGRALNSHSDLFALVYAVDLMYQRTRLASSVSERNFRFELIKETFTTHAKWSDAKRIGEVAGVPLDKATMDGCLL